MSLPPCHWGQNKRHIGRKRRITWSNSDGTLVSWQLWKQMPGYEIETLFSSSSHLWEFLPFPPISGAQKWLESPICLLLNVAESSDFSYFTFSESDIQIKNNFIDSNIELGCGKWNIAVVWDHWRVWLKCLIQMSDSFHYLSWILDTEDWGSHMLIHSPDIFWVSTLSLVRETICQECPECPECPFSWMSWTTVVHGFYQAQHRVLALLFPVVSLLPSMIFGMGNKPDFMTMVLGLVSFSLSCHSWQDGLLTPLCKVKELEGQARNSFWLWGLGLEVVQYCTCCF